MISRKDLELVCRKITSNYVTEYDVPEGIDELIKIVWELREELCTQLALNLFAAPLEKESQKTIERLERKVLELEKSNKFFMDASHNPKDLLRIAELERALISTLSWLTSYPGRGALNCYDRVRKVLGD